MTGPTGPDRLAMRLLADVPADHRDAVVAMLAAGDGVARALTVADLHRTILASWMTFAVIDAWGRDERDLAKSLDYIAGALTADVGGRMAIIAGLAALDG